MTWIINPSFEESVKKILDSWPEDLILHRDTILNKMGYGFTPRTKFDSAPQHIKYKQYITLVMNKLSLDPDSPWEKTEFSSSPSWIRRGSL